MIASERKRTWKHIAAGIYLLSSALLVADLTRSVSSAAARMESEVVPSAQTPIAHGIFVASEVARTLALGTRRMAAHLLRSAPSPDVKNAATGKGASRLLWPVEHGNFVRGFGYVRKTRKDLPHLGVDIAADSDTPIHAAADGLVAYADDGVKGYGNLLMIVHPDGAVTSYAHCSRLLVSPGERVERGQVVAHVGTTGISKGPHLHFEFRLQGKARDPMRRFDREPEPEAPTTIALLSRPW